MKVCVVLTHPTQFDVPVFRLGQPWMDVIYTKADQVNRIFDPELNRNVTWEENPRQGYRFESVPPQRKFNWIWNKFKHGNYDLVITNGYYTPVLAWSILAGKRWSKKNALRLDTVAFNNLRWHKKAFKYILFTVLKRVVDYFFVVGTLSRNYTIRNGVKPGRIFMYGYVSNNKFFRENRIHLEEEKKRWKDKFGINPGTKIILCVSKHNEREAPWDTLHAFAGLASAGHHLLLVGDGPLHNALIQRAKELGIQNISFAGYVEFRLLPALYSIASVFVHDSHNEPWGVSVQEAVACDIPVVASDKVGSAFDLILPGRNGFVFKAGDRDDLALKIKKALCLPEEELKKTNQNLLNYWNYQTVIENIQSAIHAG